MTEFLEGKISMDPIVEMQGVAEFFGPAHVLKGVDLSVSSGEVVVIIGASGSGKSTLIRCINGLEAFQRGEIVVDGFEMPTEADREFGGEKGLVKIRKGVGMVFQQFNLFPHKTVVENIALAPMRVRKHSRGKRENSFAASSSSSPRRACAKISWAVVGRAAAAGSNRASSSDGTTCHVVR